MRFREQEKREKDRYFERQRQFKASLDQ